MGTEPEHDRTDEPKAHGLGGFAEASSIQPGTAETEEESDSDVPTAPADPGDAPAPNGPLNPA